MSNPMNKGSLFPEKLIPGLINKVKGHSSLAALSPQIPVAFNGNKEFTFSLDSEVDIVAESGAKSHGGLTAAPVTIVPVKFEYGARVSDEFMYASEEEQIPVLEAFAEGFSKKIASGIDKADMHGINPRTGVIAAVLGTNYFDSKVTATVSYDAAKPDKSIEDAIAKVETADGDVTGIAISPAVRQDLAAMVNSANDAKYPEFKFGGKPSNLGTNQLDINKTVSAAVKATAEAEAKAVDQAIVGDFANMFKWGYAKEIPMEIIEYGNPDNSDAGDLKGHNQVYIRAEAYVGWGIMDGASFCRVVPSK